MKAFFSQLKFFHWIKKTNRFCTWIDRIICRKFSLFRIGSFISSLPVYYNTIFWQISHKVQTSLKPMWKSWSLKPQLPPFLTGGPVKIFCKSQIRTWSTKKLQLLSHNHILRGRNQHQKDYLDARNCVLHVAFRDLMVSDKPNSNM